MTRKNPFLRWDQAGPNEMCFNCSRCDSRDRMCPWLRSEEPVPGWIAVEAGEAEGIQSIKILRCPLFLDSPEDPGMTHVEYRQLCRSLVVELYRRMLEYRRLYLDIRKAKIRTGSEFIRLKKDFKHLKRKLEKLEAQKQEESAAS